VLRDPDVAKELKANNGRPADGGRMTKRTIIVRAIPGANQERSILIASAISSQPSVPWGQPLSAVRRASQAAACKHGNLCPTL